MKQVYLSNDEHYCKASWIPKEIKVQYPYTEIIPPVELKQPKFNWKNGEWEETYNKSIMEQNEQLKEKFEKYEEQSAKHDEKLSETAGKLDRQQAQIVSSEQAILSLADVVLSGGNK